MDRPEQNVERRISSEMYIPRFKTQFKNDLEMSINSNKNTSLKDIQNRDYNRNFVAFNCSRIARNCEELRGRI